MSKLTTKKKISIRESTYREPKVVYPCSKCEHYQASIFNPGKGNCHLIIFRDDVRDVIVVDKNGTCDLWEPKYEH